VKRGIRIQQAFQLLPAQHLARVRILDEVPQKKESRKFLSTGLEKFLQAIPPEGPEAEKTGKE
jgi:hypothetical protein